MTSCRVARHLPAPTVPGFADSANERPARDTTKCRRLWLTRSPWRRRTRVPVSETGGGRARANFARRPPGSLPPRRAWVQSHFRLAANAQIANRTLAAQRRALDHASCAPASPVTRCDPKPAVFLTYPRHDVRTGQAALAEGGGRTLAAARVVTNGRKPSPGVPRRDRTCDGFANPFGLTPPAVRRVDEKLRPAHPALAVSTSDFPPGSLP
jgi:hypothetical protein